MKVNYLCHMKRGDRAYTQEGFLKAKDLMGVSVLQTSLQDTPAEEVFALYKKRWAIKTYFDYFKNG